MHTKSLQSCWLFVTLWIVARQAPLSMGLFKKEYLSVLPCPPPGDLPDSGLEPMSPASAGEFFTRSATWKVLLACEMSAIAW